MLMRELDFARYSGEKKEEKFEGARLSWPPLGALIGILCLREMFELALLDNSFRSKAAAGFLKKLSDFPKKKKKKNETAFIGVFQAQSFARIKRSSRG